jgi:hypothetical protein
MKVGFSYSRCVRDIVDGTIDINDVLVIVARTDFDPRDDTQWSGIWRGYGGGTSGDAVENMFSHSFPEWAGRTNESRFREISIALWESGKLHQPRRFGAKPTRSNHAWVDTGPIGVEHQPRAVQDAWNQYQVLASLAQPAKKEFTDNF